MDADVVNCSSMQVGESLSFPVSSAEFWPSIDPQAIFSQQNWGMSNFIGIHNQVGLYNGVGLWSQLGSYTGIGFGVDVGGHCDAQPNLESSAARIDFNSGNGNLNGFWKYNGVEITNEATDSTSDISLKKDIQPLENCLDKVLQLQSVSFNWVEELVPSRYVKDRPEIGLIAQEVEKVVPEVVGQKFVVDGEYKSINYGKLTAVLIGAIKEQQDQINSLKETVNKLSTQSQKVDGVCYDV